MILMKISSYLILEAEHRHTIRRKCICNPIWLAIAFSLFGTVGYLAFFGRAAVFDVGAVELNAVCGHSLNICLDAGASTGITSSDC